MNNSDANVLRELIKNNGYHVCLVSGKTPTIIDGYKEVNTDNQSLFYDNVGNSYEQRVLSLNIMTY